MFEDSETISASRTYIVAVYDIVAPNDVRFEKVILDEDSKNTSNHARFLYLSEHQEQGLRILACIAVENFVHTVNEVFEETSEPMTENIKVVTVSYSPSLQADMERVREMLEDWERKQPVTSINHTMSMRAILRQIDHQATLIETMKRLIDSAANTLKGGY